MARVICRNHSSVLVPRQDRERIRKFYCDVLGGKIMKADPERDFIRLGENFYIGFLFGDVTDESEFLRSFRTIWRKALARLSSTRPSARNHVYTGGSLR
jgi:catechol 2,3-dioxygenase-like lactoylglutathione lyase family enzyme